MKKEKKVDVSGRVERTLEAFRKTKAFLVSQGHLLTEVSFNIHENNGDGPTLTIHAQSVK